MKIPVLHDIEDGEDGGCGEVAFYTLAPLRNFNRLPSANVADIEMLDGTKPEIGKLLTCGNCGKVWTRVLKDCAYLMVGQDQEVPSTALA